MSNFISTKVFTKISELDPFEVFDTTDEFVAVNNNVTKKITGLNLTESIVSIGNLASKAYVDAVVDGAPELLDTLNELAAALNDDENFATTITALINTKLSTANFGLEFSSALATKTTSDVTEGTNLYYTEQRVLDVVIPLVPTSIFDLDVPEVSVNLPGYLHYNGTTLSWESSTNPTYDTVTILAEPTSDNHAATKGYVDNQITDVVAGQGFATLDYVEDAIETALDAVASQFTTENLNVKNIAFTGTGAVNITSGNDLNFVAAGAITFNGNELATVATTGSYTDLINNPVQWQDVSGYIQTGYTFNEPMVSTGSSGGPGSTATEGQLVTYNWANYTNESGIYAYYPGANFANGNIPNPAVQDIKTFAINYQYVSSGASVPSATDWINWGNNLKNASASKFLIVKTTDGKQIVYEITSVISDSQTNNSQVHQHTINVNFLKFNGGDPTALIKNVTYPPKIFWAGNISTNILNYYLDLTSISGLTNNIVVVTESNTRIAMPNASTYPGRTIDISNKSVSSLLQIELDLPNNILSDYILVNTFATFKSNGTRWAAGVYATTGYVAQEIAAASLDGGEF